MDPAKFFEAVRTYDKSAENYQSQGWSRFATVDPNYTGAGPARVQFDGEASVSQKSYHFVGQTPLAGKRAFLVPVGNTYVILGNLNGGA